MDLSTFSRTISGRVLLPGEDGYLERLRRITTAYDFGNLFRGTHNIRPV